MSLTAETTPQDSRSRADWGEASRTGDRPRPAICRHTISPDGLNDATAQIGVTQAALRNPHLKYHLETVQILSAHQMQQSAVLSGYKSDAPIEHHNAHKKGRKIRRASALSTSLARRLPVILALAASR